MALEVSMTGTGSIGDITPNWTVNEFATPVAIGSLGAGTGSVSLNAKANDDSLLCINNNVVSTVNGFGTVNGVVQSVNETGINVSLTHGTLLDKFNLDLNVPPLLGGDVVSAIDYFEQAVLGNARTTKTNTTGVENQFFTMGGHGYSFIADGDGKAVFQQPTGVSKSISYLDTGSVITTYPYYDVRNQLSCANFVRFDGHVYGNNVDGNMFYSEPVGGANQSSTFTVTIASPATATYTGDFLANNDEVIISTTGSLPNISGTVTISSTKGGQRPGGSPGFPLYGAFYYAVGHKVQAGDSVTFSGFSNASYNGTKTILGVDGDWFYANAGGLLPPGGSGSGAVSGVFRTTPYVVNVTSTTFQMALQSGGSAIGTTGSQSGVHTVALGGTADRASRIYYKTMLNGSDNSFHIVGEPEILSFDWVLDATMLIDYSAETLSFVGEYAAGGSPVSLSGTTSVASLDLDSELAVFFQYYIAPGGNYTLRATVCNTSDYSVYVTLSETLSPSSVPLITSWDITGNARDVYLQINSASDATLTTEEYTIDSTFYVDESTRTFSAPVIAYAGVFWEYLQMGCAAFSQEISVNGDTVTVRNVGEQVFDITNVVASPTINPTSTLSGRQINIAYSDSAFVDGTVYSAADDGNNIISVRAGETTVTSVKHTVNPTFVKQPTRSDTWPIGDGQYYVIDSSGVVLLAGEWDEYGASVSVEIDPDDPAAIQITVVGPYTDTTLAGGPYELAASDGENKYAALNISGTGVYSGDNALGLLTGIDPEKYTRATVNTITNPFIANLEQAYDRGVWAAQKASGPLVTMSAQIPSSSISGIGLTCGSLVAYRNSTYRIMSCSISGIGASITAERFVTVADVDAIWGTGITAPKTFTMTIASPAVFTSSTHGLVDGDFVSFSTTGELPDNAATSSTIWGGYVINSATNTFQLSATPGGSAINSTGSQSGTHSFITGDTSVAEYDGFWENYECQDQIIFPYLEA
jgi:hypothetical protein